MGKARKKNVANNYQLGPNEKPILGEIREVLLKISEATCLDVDYNLIDQGAFLQSLTSTLHKKLKSIVKPRYKYTLQTFLVQNNDQGCLLYTSPSPRDVEESRMPSSA